MARANYLPEALEDLFGIWRHVAIESQSESVADRWIDALDETCRRFATQPFMGEARPELALNVRSFSVGKYVVFYIPMADGIEVIRIIHGARDIPEHFRK